MFCKNCGNELMQSEEYCAECGQATCNACAVGHETVIRRRRYGKIAFIVGLAVGMMFMAALTGVHGIYARQRLGGVDPTTKVREIYGILERYSMHEFDMDYMLGSMYRGLIDGIGDHNAQYLDASSFEAFNQRIGGTFVGVGIQIIVDPDDDTVTVVTVFRGAPAEEAGILPGDKIIYVDGNNVVGSSIEEVVSMITGRENTRVSLTIFRPLEGIELVKVLFRRRVEVPSVNHEIHSFGGEKIGYIQITTFDNMTHGQFENALDDLLKNNASGIVIDLRNNSGGLLSSVNSITNMLIPEGIVTFTEDAAGNRNNYYSDKTYLDIPLAVLVNEISASASEILSGAVKDTGVGTIVGTSTFGKGTVQQTFELSDSSAIVITVRKYFTPNGVSIDGVGIEPNVHVEMNEELIRRIGNLPLHEDIQKQAAFDVILGKLK